MVEFDGIGKVTINDLPLDAKTVLVRVDFNVPFKPNTCDIADPSRVRASLPTILNLTARQSKVILCSHMGRPNGKKVPALSLRPVAHLLSNDLGRRVLFSDDCLGDRVSQQVREMGEGDVLLLENLRFHREEELNDRGFAMKLASLADFFVNDAFGVSHRSHASITGIPSHLPSAAGLLLEREIKMLGDVLSDPKRPLIALLGGSKISDKLKMVEKLVGIADNVLIGGGMAATFLKAAGFEVGHSPVESELFGFVHGIYGKDEVRSGFSSVHLPSDVVVQSGQNNSSSHRVVSIDNISPVETILDIGPDTISKYRLILEESGTVLWNGPLGMYEFPQFALGTQKLAEVISGGAMTSVVGGGSTADAVTRFGFEPGMDHVSTGGGASLEFLQNGTLPGISVIPDK